MRAEIVPVAGLIEMSTCVAPRPVVVTLTISSRCQLRVVADGSEILGRVMEPGETVPIELGDELLLLGDNASAVQFSINGQAGRLLGEPWRRALGPHRPRRLPGFPGPLQLIERQRPAAAALNADAGFFPARRSCA